MAIAPACSGAGDQFSKGRAGIRAALGVFCTLLAIAALLVAAAAAQAKGPPYGIKPKPKPKPPPVLSQYDVTTHFAIAALKMPAYRDPDTRSQVVKELAFFTPDNEALQTYRLVASRRVKHVLWEEIDVPTRPNGQVGWVKRSWLGSVESVHTLVVVDVGRETLTVYNRGKELFAAPVGTGHRSDPNWPTPTGRYWIAEEFPSADAFYGPWAFGTTDYATDTDFPDGSIVGIHGTNEPWLIPGDPSHGCIRLKDADILKLKGLVGIGTPIWILPAAPA